MIARHGTASHVEKLVHTYRRIDRMHEAARANRHRSQRALQWRYDDDGSMLITVRLPAEQGALVLKAITAAADFARAERDGADRESMSAQDVSAETCTSLWQGERIDLDMAVGGLMRRHGMT